MRLHLAVSGTRWIPATCVVALVLSANACNQSGQTDTEEIQVEANQPLTPQEERDLRVNAGLVLLRTNQARDSLLEEDPAAAKEHVQQSLDELSKVEQMLPRYKVTIENQSSTESGTESKEMKPDVVPISTEYGEVDLYGPVEAARNELEAKKGQTATEEIYSGDEFTSISLDVGKARMELQRAQKDLEDGKDQDADTALREVQLNAVVFNAVELDRPLRQTADNLNAALWDLKQDHVADAQKDLDAAVAALHSYEGNTLNRNTGEVRDLEEGISEVRAELKKEDQQKQKHIGRLTDLWNRVVRRL